MSATIPKTEPVVIAAGDTAKWSKSLADYPASEGWALAYEFVNAAARFAASGVADGDEFVVTIPAATTGGLASGGYEWRARVSKAGEVYTVATGRTTVAPNFNAAVDARSQARRTLEAIEAVIEGRADSATAEYEIAGRKLRYIAIAELLTLRDRYRMDVLREDAASAAARGLPSPGRIFLRHQ